MQAVGARLLGVGRTADGVAAARLEPCRRLARPRDQAAPQRLLRRRRLIAVDRQDLPHRDQSREDVPGRRVYVVMADSTYGRYGYDLYSYGLYSYGL